MHRKLSKSQRILDYTEISLLDKGSSGPEIIYDVGGIEDRRHILRAV